MCSLNGFLSDANSKCSLSHQKDGWPNNLLDTLFELPPSFSDPLAFGANTYSLYVNYTARNNGPQHEAWEYGTFTGDILSFEGAGLFENAIDIDGDGSSDVAVGLSLVGLGTQGEGWGVTWSDGLIPTIESTEMTSRLRQN